MIDDGPIEATPLVELRDIRKTYDTGGGITVDVLHGISLSIAAGEFVAVMGASGSGKSTLMNILGCLDRPSGGTYLFDGEDVATFDRDRLALLRRNAFGFIFQLYNLIPSSTTTENVEVPGVYAGMAPDQRRARAETLLTRLGLGTRLHHRPNQLSGGQQQRVSIARALMNGGTVILADEPTGALDSKSGAEVCALLRELAAEGHTIILITHDIEVARIADRIIEMRDGRLVSDESHRASTRSRVAENPPQLAVPGASVLADAGEALRAGRAALMSNPFRTLLTLLGIIIGVASVIALLAIGEGAKQVVLSQLAIFGTNRLYVIPGGDSERGPGGILTTADADLVRTLPNVAASMPYLQGNLTVRFGNVDHQITGVAATSDYPRVLNWQLAKGSFFTPADDRSLATVAVIGSRVRDILFPDGQDPMQKFILVNNVPFQVIGVLATKGALSGNADDDDTIVVPFATGSQRLYGKTNLSWISVLVDDLSKADDTVNDITAALTEKHHVKDFQVYNKAATIQAQSRTQDTVTLLLGFTAAITLIVGGIGVMNVMLMTVTERTREIGIRMANGARPADIRRQFLTEAVLLSAIGGVIGVGTGLTAGLCVALARMPVIFTLHAILLAFGCAVLTGVAFGYMPARRASLLDPVIALARE